MSGIGAHEVIVETTDHSKSPALLKESEVNTIVDTYVNRYKKLSERKELKYIQDVYKRQAIECLYHSTMADLRVQMPIDLLQKR